MAATITVLSFHLSHTQFQSSLEQFQTQHKILFMSFLFVPSISYIWSKTIESGLLWQCHAGSISSVISVIWIWKRQAQKQRKLLHLIWFYGDANERSRLMATRKTTLHIAGKLLYEGVIRWFSWLKYLIQELGFTIVSIGKTTSALEGVGVAVTKAKSLWSGNSSTNLKHNGEIRHKI